MLLTQIARIIVTPRKLTSLTKSLPVILRLCADLVKILSSSANLTLVWNFNLKQKKEFHIAIAEISPMNIN